MTTTAQPVAELRDCSTLTQVFKQDDGKYRFAAYVTDTKELELLREVKDLSLSQAMQEVTLWFVAEWEGATEGGQIFPTVRDQFARYN